MLIRFHARWNLEYDRIFTLAFLTGTAPDTFEIEWDAADHEGLWRKLDDADVGVVIGVKGTGPAIVEHYRQTGRVGIMIDKGYIRQAPDNYWSLNLNGMRPTAYAFQKDQPDDRLRALQFALKPMRTSGKHVLLFALSPKGLRAFEGDVELDRIPDSNDTERSIKRQTEMFADIADTLLKYTRRAIHYRPRGAKEHDLFHHSQVKRIDPFRESIEQSLANAWCAINHTSNACVNAILNGIPVIELGYGVARPIASRHLKDVEDVFVPTEDERQRWLRQISYVQWRVDEIASGKAWAHLRPIIESLRTKT